MRCKKVLLSHDKWHCENRGKLAYGTKYAQAIEFDLNEDERFSTQIWNNNKVPQKRQEDQIILVMKSAASK